jgi:hypothetical protein
MAQQFTGSLGSSPREYKLNPGYPRPGFRISFLFKTPRKRRLLLVQLVSMEVGDEEEIAGALMPTPKPCMPWCESYARLLDEHERLSVLSPR